MQHFSGSSVKSDQLDLPESSRFRVAHLLKSMVFTILIESTLATRIDADDERLNLSRNVWIRYAISN